MAAKKKAAAKQKKPAKRASERKTPAAPQPAAAATAPTPKLDTSMLDELLKVTGQPAPAKGEKLKAFVERMAGPIAELSDDAFKALSQDARDWYQANYDAYNAGAFDKLVAAPGMPGYDASASDDEPVSPAPVSEAAPQETPPTSIEEEDMKKKVAAKKSTTKKAAGNGSATERKPRTDGMSYKVRQAVVSDPAVEFEAVCKKLGLKGKDAAPTGHAHNMFAHAKHVMAIAGEHYSLRAK